MNKRMDLDIGGLPVQLTSLDKVMYPEIGLTKADVIDYYIKISQYILPYLKDRPISMIPFVHGADGKSFFQKQRPKDAPDWVASVEIASGDKVKDYCMINNLPSLLYMANRGCLEMHAWFSRYPALDTPDVAVFDIDPSGNTGFEESRSAAMLIRMALDSFSLWSIPKTSGKKGIHIFVPIEPTPYEKVREFLIFVCGMVEEVQSELFTLERSIQKRGSRVYLDAVQNGRGKTLPAPYSLRATPEATVSAPVSWDELEGKSISPADFTINNIIERIERIGDLFEPVYSLRQRLPNI